MGVPAFYRWLSEKYPKVVLDVIEERVQIEDGSMSIRKQLDCTKPNPIDGIGEVNNLYIDMNGIIHPCSHPEIGPQPTTEEEMYSNVCNYIDRLFRIYRPRSLLYLAIDGVAPRAKMNQQRSRRFRSAQEARELAELESRIYKEVVTEDDDDNNDNDNDMKKEKEKKKAWDSNVITPGTPFMIKLAEFVRFYIRKRISTDPAWKTIKVIFSDASIPGEGEHKIMNHIRLQRTCVGYNPNTVHVLHGLDADLIMLALATHEVYFYISREEVLFGRKSEQQKDQRQIESGHKDRQALLDADAGADAMQLVENSQKPLQLISIPILREYLAIEFHQLLQPKNVPLFPNNVTLERIIDDFVFMCFFVGNDFLPHLPSLDIRDGALDFLINVYQRLLPTMGDYITKSGGIVNLKNVDILLAEVGAIEDYVFQMKYESEQQDKQRKQEQNEIRNNARNRNNNNNPTQPPTVLTISGNNHPIRGKAAKILERTLQSSSSTKDGAVAVTAVNNKKNNKTIVASHIKTHDNVDAAKALKLALLGGNTNKSTQKKKDTTNDNKDDNDDNNEEEDEDEVMDDKHNDAATDADGEETANKQKKKKKRKKKKKTDEEKEEENSDKMDTTASSTTEKNDKESSKNNNNKQKNKKKRSIGEVGDAEDEFDADADLDDDVKDKVSVKKSPEAVKFLVKEKVRAAQQKQLDEYAKTVVDNVRLHESGWKDRYYTDKCKADDVENHGGREHMFRSYVMGLCWVMKYYYDGVPSWKWYYPFHYGPFASDLKNIERFEKDCKSFQLSIPFNPIEQLMAVLPSDSAHAIPKASRWLMSDPESPILDFYPIDVPVDPNGKAMPWLWVVLLPFIDEERLLSALSATMKDWTPAEKLCNARGLDDGYLYVHRTEHPLVSKLASIITDADGGKNKKALSIKARLTDMVRYGISGSVRPPLSNELYPMDDDVSVPLPPTAAVISRSITDEQMFLDDGVFTEPIDRNDAVCVAFTEPPKLSHKSILLAGVKLPRPVLTSPGDRQIRRPKLNRFGGSIAHMGGGGGNNNNSHQSGYGSMNISQFERDLARQNGRGHELYQAGTRTWGSLEPTPKRFHSGGHSQVPPPLPTNGQQQGYSFAGNHQQQQNQNGQSRSNNNSRSSRWGTAAPPSQQQVGHQGHQQQYNNNNRVNHGHNNNQPQQYAQSYQQQQQGFYQNNQQYNVPPPPPPPPPRFGNYNGGHPNNNNNSNQTHHRQQQQQQGHNNRANADVMNSLRAQLSSTLSRTQNNKRR